MLTVTVLLVTPLLVMVAQVVPVLNGLMVITTREEEPGEDTTLSHIVRGHQVELAEEGLQEEAALKIRGLTGQRTQAVVVVGTLRRVAVLVDMVALAVQVS